MRLDVALLALTAWQSMSDVKPGDGKHTDNTGPRAARLADDGAS